MKKITVRKIKTSAASIADRPFMLPFEAKLKIENIVRELNNTDTILVKFIEDLVYLLVKKGVIKKEELPIKVVEGLFQRNALRKELKQLQTVQAVAP